MINITPGPRERITVNLTVGDFDLLVHLPTFKQVQAELFATTEERCDLLLSLVRGWEGVQQDGNPVEYSREKLEWFFTLYPAAYSQSIIKIGEYLKRHRLTETDAKN